MTYPFTIDNNSSPNPSGVEFVHRRLACVRYDSLVVKLNAIASGFIRRRLLICGSTRGWVFQPRRRRFEKFSFFNPPFLK